MAIIVMVLVKAETKWLGTKKTFEWFSTAGRNVKSGLIASSVLSSWTWAATLLQSSTVTYEFGIAGLFWYAAGASIQVVLFAILAIELDLIVMGSKGLVLTEQEIGSVARKGLRLTRKPVIFL
jgi:Na+/proline symporter